LSTWAAQKNKSPAAQNTTELGLEMHGVQSKASKNGFKWNSSDTGASDMAST